MEPARRVGFSPPSVVMGIAALAERRRPFPWIASGYIGFLAIINLTVTISLRA
jgi:hypothetical protein